MNRRGFLKFLASIPIIRHIPLPSGIYGDGADGDIVLTKNQMLSPDQARKYYEFKGYGGGGGGVVIFVEGTLKVTANGGVGGPGVPGWLPPNYGKVPRES